MEGANSWALFRTMSFISSRAKAFKERFSHRQRSLSDSWMDQTSLDYTNIDDTCGAPAFEGGGSMLSLLDDNAEWGPSIVVQRSKSLESMSTYHRPSIATIYSSAVPLQCTQSSASIAVTPNSRRSSTIMQSVPLPKRSEQLSVPSCEYIPQFFSTPLLQSPAVGGDDDLLMSFGPSDDGTATQFPDSRSSSRTIHQPSPSPILSRSRPCVPKAILSTSCNHITDSDIPKIPGPPSTPKKMRPHSAYSLDPGAFDNSKDSPSLLDLSNESLDNKPLIDMSSPPQRRKSRPLSCISFDPLLNQEQENQVPHTSSIPNLTKETSPIPKIKAPPSSPRSKTKLSSTRSLNPFVRQTDFFHFNNQSTSIPNLNLKCSDSAKTSPFGLPAEPQRTEKPPQPESAFKPVFAESDQSEKSTLTARTPYKKKMSISSSSLTLNLHNRKSPMPFDPEQWRKYVEETFPSIQETGECSIKTEKPKTKNATNEKIKEKALPQVLKKQRQYSKLKHQSSMDESRHYRVDQTVGNDANARLMEKRRTFLMRKQNNSAPDTMDDEDVEIPRVACKEKEVNSVNLCLGGRCRARGSDSSILLPTIKLEPEVGIEHLDDLKYPDADPPCHFCSQQTSTSIHDENRLKIVSGGLVRKRDGSRDDSANHYMNLPSPMIHNENGDPDQVFRSKCSATPKDDLDQIQNNFLDELKEAQPPPSAFSRRRAIVTSKLTTSNLDDHKLSWSSNYNTPRNRRSSIVVIPPMQICPGDLLVYSKVLTNRQKTLDLESSAQCLNFESDESRKGKNTWSLLKLFERSNRGKSGSIGGLDEVLGCIQRAEFEDEELSYYRGLSWFEFYTKVEEKRRKREGKAETDTSNPSDDGTKEPSSPTGSRVLPGTSKTAELFNFETTVDIEAMPGTDLSKSPTRSDRSPLSEPTKPKKSEKPEKQENTVKKLHRKLVRAQSERCFERSRLPSWRVKEKPLPIKPSPLVQTLSEKSLLVSPVSTTSQGEYKRREAVWDLFQSECAFLFDHLMVLKNVFLEPLKRIQVEGYAMFAEPQLLFGNLDELCSVTHNFCKSFIRILLAKVGPDGELPTTEVLAQLFQKNEDADFLSQAYHCYALNYINALNYLETLRTYTEFCEFEKWCNKDARCKKLQLTDLLVAPVQHIMKVPLILKEVESRTENLNEKVIISQILEIEEKSIRELDDKMKWLKNFERLLEIQRNIFWPSVQELDPKIFVPDFLKPALQRQPCDRIIVSPRRQIIIEGQLQILDSGKAQEVFVVLFDDMLLITKRKKGLSKKKSTLSENWASSCRSSANTESSMRYVVYKQPLSLDRFFVYDISLPESVSCRLEFAFVLVVMNRFQQVVTIHSFQTSSDQVKQNWVTKLRETQEKWKKTLENTMFRPVSPQDSRNQNAGLAAELSVCESMSTCVGGRSQLSVCGKSFASVCSSSADLCSTVDRSSPLPGPSPARHSSEDDDSESMYPSLKLAPSATKHKKSF
ncbi:UNVERIFIED_CONTAM: hypothetical protein PYX00_010071 [Menopon gallinae]|uniref:Pleckstrin homology domain-containing family G member 7 n=1 Tax=Menopon gallinae TaxID=328185 RepID=A0AAW2HEL6_9NEOP